MPKALVLLGTTASGKSELAMELAKKSLCSFGISVEIVVADSMQVYKGMDIGTAKPTATEQKEVRHHCIDLVEPTEDFAVEPYKQAATQALNDNKTGNNKTKVNKINKIIVGGTGLYIRAIVDDLEIPRQYPEVKERLEAEPDTEALWEQLNKYDPKSAKRTLPNNRRRILRALEVTLGANKPFSSFGKGLQNYQETDFLQVGIKMPRPVLDSRIDLRYEQQMKAGFLDEVATLAQNNLSKPARQALGYKEFLAYFDKTMSLEDALLAARQRTKRFARRQERWFRRDPRIKWLECEDPKEVFPDLFTLYTEYFGIN